MCQKKKMVWGRERCFCCSECPERGHRGAVPKVTRSLKSKQENTTLSNLKTWIFEGKRTGGSTFFFFFPNSHGSGKVFLSVIWLVPILTSWFTLCKFLVFVFNKCHKDGKVKTPQVSAAYDRNKDIWKPPVILDQSEPTRSFSKVKDLSCHLKHRWLWFRKQL